MNSVDNFEKIEKIENVENNEVNEQVSDTQPVEPPESTIESSVPDFESNYGPGNPCPCSSPYSSKYG